MRVVAIYDIHSNLPALEAILQEIRQTVSRPYRGRGRCTSGTDTARKISSSKFAPRRQPTQISLRPSKSASVSNPVARTFIERDFLHVFVCKAQPAIGNCDYYFVVFNRKFLIYFKSNYFTGNVCKAIQPKRVRV